ncbi:hypothetical protein BD410DRAFT_840762 [Rickenella mellea]|uniref:Uncharacterized protein n=1 Tax=Rickenella mellea TaxID=50990 RepID=A0A4Y7Q140_9AGAM|nr:hypothetical protein BD410DRAFT_840762 [Rickenella mellea]
MSSANSFVEVLDRDSVADVLFDHASPATMYRIGWTCWMARRAVQDYSRRTFNINRHLRRFFDDPIGFRNLQAQTGTLISGAFAHGFLDRTLRDEACLDLYIYSQHALEVGLWVMQNGGKVYRFKRIHGQHPDFDSAVNAVVKGLYWPRDVQGDDGFETYHLGWYQNLLKFATHEEEPALAVRIFVSQYAPLKSLIEHNWHSTAFMNVISFYAAYSSHPFATFEKKTSLAFRFQGEEPFKIDQQMGYDVINSVQDLEKNPSKSFEVGRPRHLDDALSWVLPFDMRGISWPKLSPGNHHLSFDPCSLNSWSFIKRYFSRGTRIGTHHWQIKDEIFKFQYCYAEMDKDLRRIIEGHLKMERAKQWIFPNQERRTWHDEVLFDYKMGSLKTESLACRLLGIFGGRLSSRWHTSA